jgi:hypothetical protein
MDDDPYGFCCRLEKEAGKDLSKKGLAAFIEQIRARYDGRARVNPRTGGGFREEPEYRRRRWDKKASFMPGFEKLVSGVGPGDEPSFLERAKARWNKGHRKEE